MDQSPARPAPEDVDQAGRGGRRWCHALRPFDSHEMMCSLRVAPSMVEGRLACIHALAQGHSPRARRGGMAGRRAGKPGSKGLPRASAPAIVGSRLRVEWPKRLGV